MRPHLGSPPAPLLPLRGFRRGGAGRGGGGGGACAESASTGHGSGSGSGSGGGSMTTTSSGTGGAPAGCKRGIATTKTPGAAFAPNVAWWYNWQLYASIPRAGIEYVPMV